MEGCRRSRMRNSEIWTAFPWVMQLTISRMPSSEPNGLITDYDQQQWRVYVHQHNYNYYYQTHSLHWGTFVSTCTVVAFSVFVVSQCFCSSVPTRMLLKVSKQGKDCKGSYHWLCPTNKPKYTTVPHNHSYISCMEAPNFKKDLKEIKEIRRM